MSRLPVMSTGVPNLDPVLGGGFPLYSLNIIAGLPGAGKTTLVQQMLFHCIRTSSCNALYLTTVSEPALKVVRYMQHFAFFDPEAFGSRVLYQDIGRIIQQRPLPAVADQILELVSAQHVEFLVIDSFKAIRDLTEDMKDFRNFCHDLSVRLSSNRCTTFLVGEYERRDLANDVEFAVADGVLYLDRQAENGQEHRLLQPYKMRGQAIENASVPFVLTREGICLLAPAAAKTQPDAGRPDSSGLSQREKEVVRLIARGMTNQEIAQRLLLSLNTIKTHRLRVYEKLGFHSRSELVVYAHAQGLLDEGLKA